MTRRCMTSWVPKAPTKMSRDRIRTRSDIEPPRYYIGWAPSEDVTSFGTNRGVRSAVMRAIGTNRGIQRRKARRTRNMRWFTITMAANITTTEMQRDYIKEWSRHLGRDMEILHFGHAGRPLLVFP